MGAVHKRYYRKAYELFSRYDEGIRMTDAQWYSVTPEDIARVTAVQIQRHFPEAVTILDGFGGAGGNTIQLALLYGSGIIYNELDTQVFEDAQHNAAIYGVESMIKFHNMDYFALADTVFATSKPDVVFMSPPWGGPQYLGKEVWELDDSAVSLRDIILHSQQHLSRNMALFLPRNTNLKSLLELIPETDKIQAEFVHTRGFCKGVVVYLGPDLVVLENSL